MPMPLNIKAFALEVIPMNRIASPVTRRLSLALATLACAILAVGTTASAQTATYVELPQLTMRGGTGLRSLIEIAGVTLSVDRDAYVAAFALSPSRLDAPFQVLSPAAPK